MLKKLIPVVATMAIGMTSLSSYAGDCRQVKFQFVNKYKVAGTGVEIKIKKVHIVGNDGTWNENIANKKVDPNKTHTTNKRKLNKLDSGKNGTFTVHFDHRKIGPGWQSGTHGPFTIKCDDGKTIKFTIM
jgi:hypothetical protein